MTDYNAILDTECEPDAPVTSQLVFALRDNPVAITEGAAGAPRIVDASLSTSATNTGRDWVLARNAKATAGAIGTYAMLAVTSASYSPIPGDIIPSTFLAYAGAGGTSSGLVSAGDWMCMGGAAGSSSADPGRVTLFLRVS